MFNCCFGWVAELADAYHEPKGYMERGNLCRFESGPNLYKNS